MHRLIRLPTPGTHDIMRLSNGWYNNLEPEQQEYVDACTAIVNRLKKLSQAMLRMLFATVSDTAIATMQRHPRFG